jgi:hypothetical protein
MMKWEGKAREEESEARLGKVKLEERRGGEGREGERR